MHKGSCLCGAVRYEIRGQLGPLMYCHCSLCRKANGTAFLAACAVASADFHVVEGSDALRGFRHESGAHRMFCGNCGSPIFSKRENMPETIRVRIGTLDTPLESKVTAHIFVGSKAEWHDILDAAPQHEARP